jgi:hypothetical protein
VEIRDKKVSGANSGVLSNPDTYLYPKKNTLEGSRHNTAPVLL